MMVEIKHIDLPAEMQRAMARQAEAERLRRAKVISAEGEFQAAARLGEAAAVMEKEPVAIQLRMLQTLGADRHGEEPHRHRAVPDRPACASLAGRRQDLSDASVDREHLRAAPPAADGRRSARTPSAIFPAAPERTRSNDVEYRYRQDSDFYYLTGFAEPGAVCVLRPGTPRTTTCCSCARATARTETWTGRRAGVEGAVSDYGADAAYPIDELDAAAAAAARRARPALLRAGPRRAVHAARAGLARRGAQLSRAAHRHAVRPALLDPRADCCTRCGCTRSRTRSTRMRRAIADHRRGASRPRCARRAPGGYEYEIEALIEYAFRRRGARRPGVPVDRRRRRQRDDPALHRQRPPPAAPATCCSSTPAPSTTATAPTSRAPSRSGRAFERRRARVYDARARRAAGGDRRGAPGRHASTTPHQAALRRAGRRPARARPADAAARDEVIEKERYKPFYMHRTSHWLGMDVHDVGALQARRRAARRSSPAWC